MLLLAALLPTLFLGPRTDRSWGWQGGPVLGAPVLPAVLTSQQAGHSVVRSPTICPVHGTPACQDALGLQGAATESQALRCLWQRCHAAPSLGALLRLPVSSRGPLCQLLSPSPPSPGWERQWGTTTKPQNTPVLKVCSLEQQQSTGICHLLAMHVPRPRCGRGQQPAASPALG